MKTPLNFRVISYANDKFQPHSVERLTEDGTKYDATFTCGDYVTNGTKMRGHIERFELSSDLSSLFVFTDWSGVGMDLDSISKVPVNGILYTLHVIEGIFHGYAQSKGPDFPLSMINNGREIYFEMHEGGKSIASTSLKRSYLETLDHNILAEVILKNIKEVVFSNALPSAHQIKQKVQVNLLDAGMIKNCEIAKVHFSESKVMYDIYVRMTHPVTSKDIWTRLYNLDSTFVEDLLPESNKEIE